MGLENTIKLNDQRADVRYDFEAAVKWAYFNQETYFGGKILNFSAGGVYIETTYEIKPGSTIYIQVERIIANKIEFLGHQRPRFVSLGEVRWRTDLSDSDRNHYGAGIRYPFSNYA